jgi:DNA-binding winged helix-turn-helix (wHTH) protein
MTPEAGSSPASGETDGPRLLRHDTLTLDVEGRVADIDGTELALTRIEFDLLATLLGGPRRVWSRDALLRKVWGSDWSNDMHLVEVHMGNLRRKLGDDARTGRWIRTVRGVGYRLAPAETTARVEQETDADSAGQADRSDHADATAQAGPATPTLPASDATAHAGPVTTPPAGHTDPFVHPHSLARSHATAQSTETR